VDRVERQPEPERRRVRVVLDVRPLLARSLSLSLSRSLARLSDSPSRPPAHSLSITLHPLLPLLSLQTSTPSARLLLYPFHSATRLATLHTTAAQSDYFSPRHRWLPDGSAAVVNSEDGVVRVVDLQGRVRVFEGAHGAAAPREGDEEGEGAGLRSERARLRREADRGSSVVRDVEVLVDDEDAAGRPRRWRIVSCGFDKTVKVIG